ncbi:hypothetical protein CBL_13625 [Carabus blaptoides fortunei]
MSQVMANSEKNNDINVHLSQLKTYVQYCETRRTNHTNILIETESILHSFNTLKLKEINLNKHRQTLQQQCRRQEERIVELLQLKYKNEYLKEENKKIEQENVDIKEKIKNIQKNTEELLKENNRLKSLYLSNDHEAVTIEQQLELKLTELKKSWSTSKQENELEIQKYETQLETLNESINKLKSDKESMNNRLGLNNLNYKLKYGAHKNELQSLAKCSATFLSRQGDEETATKILDSLIQSKKTVEFKRIPFCHDSLSNNILGNHNRETNTRCYKKCKAILIPNADTTKPPEVVHLRKLHDPKDFSHLQRYPPFKLILDASNKPEQKYFSVAIRNAINLNKSRVYCWYMPNYHLI